MTSPNADRTTMFDLTKAFSHPKQSAKCQVRLRPLPFAFISSSHIQVSCDIKFPPPIPHRFLVVTSPLPQDKRDTYYATHNMKRLVITYL